MQNQTVVKVCWWILEQSLVWGLCWILTWYLNGGKLYYSKYVDKRGMEKIYNWLLANTGPKTGIYDLTSMAIASSVGLPVDRVRVLCTIHPQIKISHGRLADSWWVYEDDTPTRIRFV
jgi:hypothetical protein